MNPNIIQFWVTSRIKPQVFFFFDLLLLLLLLLLLSSSSAKLINLTRKLPKQRNLVMNVVPSQAIWTDTLGGRQGWMGNLMGLLGCPEKVLT